MGGFARVVMVNPPCPCCIMYLQLLLFRVGGPAVDLHRRTLEDSLRTEGGACGWPCF
jgi:hypothetical protein